MQFLCGLLLASTSGAVRLGWRPPTMDWKATLVHGGAGRGVGKGALEIMWPRYYASPQDKLENHPLSLKEVRGTLDAVLNEDLKPKIVEGTQLPQKGWKKKIQVLAPRPDGFDPLALIHVSTSPMDISARLATSSGGEVRLTGIEGDTLGGNPVNATARLKDLIQRDVKRADVRPHQSFGVELRRAIICAHVVEEWVPQKTGLAHTLMYRTVLARGIFARVAVLSHKQDDPLAVKQLTKWTAIGLEGSVPLLAGEEEFDMDEDIQSLDVLTKIKDATGQQLLGLGEWACPQEDILEQVGLLQSCVSTSFRHPKDLKSVTPYDMAQIQCMGRYPESSWAVSKRVRHSEYGGGKEEYWSLRLCTRKGWSEEKELTSHIGLKRVTECEGRLKKEDPFAEK